MGTYSLKIQLGDNTNTREIDAVINTNGEMKYNRVEYKQFSGQELGEVNTFMDSVSLLAKRFGGLEKIIIQKI